MAGPTGQVQLARIISVLGKLTPKRIFQYYSRRGTRVLYSILAKKGIYGTKVKLEWIPVLAMLNRYKSFPILLAFARKPFNREEMSDLVVVQNDEIVPFF